MLLVVDNGSLYCPRIAGALRGTELETARFDRLGPLEKYDRFVLSGRRANDAAMNAANSAVVRHCVKESKPLLGICYGAEIMALALGGTLRRCARRSGPERVRALSAGPLFPAEMDVFESHSYEIARPGPHLEPVAESDSCRHEIVAHRNGLAYGTQFHPEMTPDGRSLLRAFARLPGGRDRG